MGAVTEFHGAMERLMRDLDAILHGPDTGDQAPDAWHQWAAEQQPELQVRGQGANESAQLLAAADLVEPRVLDDGSVEQCAWLALAEAIGEVAKAATRLRLRSEPARQLRKFLKNHYGMGILNDLSLYDAARRAQRDRASIEVQALRRPDLFALWAAGLKRLCDQELWKRLDGCHLLLEELSELEPEVVQPHLQRGNITWAEAVAERVYSNSVRLIDLAIRVARFAGRWSADWQCESGRPPMEVEARRRLRDRGKQDGERMLAAGASLVAAEQAVADANAELAVAELLAREAHGEMEKAVAMAVVGERIAEHDRRCKERDNRVRAAALTAGRAPATAAQLLADAHAAVEREIDEARGNRPGEAWVRARRAATVLSQVAQPRIAAAENELAAEWLKTHSQGLRCAVDDLAAVLAPYSGTLAKMAPEGGRKLGRWIGASWSEALIALVRDLLVAAEQCDKTVLGPSLDELQQKQLQVDLRIELAKLAPPMLTEAAPEAARVPAAVTSEPIEPMSQAEQRELQEQTNVAIPTHSLASFFKDGDGWTIEFEGRRAVVKSVGGMGFIHRLLMQPGAPVPATELDGLDPRTVSSVQGLLDEDGFRFFRKRISEIDECLSGTDPTVTIEERNDLARERENLVQEMKAAASGGHKRAMNSPRDKALQRVRGAIRRAMDAIKKQHEPLWEHLNSSLIDPGGANPCYRPASSIVWRSNT